MDWGLFLCPFTCSFCLVVHWFCCTVGIIFTWYCKNLFHELLSLCFVQDYMLLSQSCQGAGACDSSIPTMCSISFSSSWQGMGDCLGPSEIWPHWCWVQSLVDQKPLPFQSQDFPECVLDAPSLFLSFFPPSLLPSLPVQLHPSLSLSHPFSLSQSPLNFNLFFWG